ncbi:amino acid ABC transporter permease [Agrobacterium tumefaciens]|jgi:polar amino acid transport system permease protein|uniref:amino acid ABC transporter permease n=1 Tax=Agrobacterium tumefaciens TaxID=358 RepID=UPI00045AC920|nr:amino acid ABC transporter permease [Agrobacterium tumefaciens]UXS34711.1 amino acid ABC transporter permease [Agrobacterium tumefaciens]CDN95230.1 Polar amino acid ABC transporter, inner membrane subunit [Agrobacterium tumefaciens]
MDYQFQWRPVLRALPEMLWGALETIEIAGLAMMLGTILAIFLALAKRSGKKYLSLPADMWIETARNTPALFQIYMLYFGLGSLGLQVGSYAALLFGITFNNAGYLAETFRGGFAAVPETQTRAARSLGLGAVQTQWHIVIPQMLRAVFHAMTNQMVWSVLMSSLGVIVGLTTDLTGVTQELNVVTYRTFEYFFVAACLYYVISKAFTLSSRIVAWRLFRY